MASKATAVTCKGSLNSYKMLQPMTEASACTDETCFIVRPVLNTFSLAVAHQKALIAQVMAKVENNGATTKAMEGKIRSDRRPASQRTRETPPSNEEYSVRWHSRFEI